MRMYKKFSESELEILEEQFKKHHYYPNRKHIKMLAKVFQSSFIKIENWFKYKRRKMYFSGKFSEYRLRKIYSDEENDSLNKYFEKDRNPDLEAIKVISVNFPQLSVNQIKNWFSNRRRKVRIDLKRSQILQKQIKKRFKNKTKLKKRDQIHLPKIMNNSQIESLQKTETKENMILPLRNILKIEKNEEQGAMALKKEEIVPKIEDHLYYVKKEVDNNFSFFRTSNIVRPQFNEFKPYFDVNSRFFLFNIFFYI